LWGNIIKLRSTIAILAIASKSIIAYNTLWTIPIDNKSSAGVYVESLQEYLNPDLDEWQVTNSGNINVTSSDNFQMGAALPFINPNYLNGFNSAYIVTFNVNGNQCTIPVAFSYVAVGIVSIISIMIITQNPQDALACGSGYYIQDDQDHGSDALYVHKGTLPSTENFNIVNDTSEYVDYQSTSLPAPNGSNSDNDTWIASEGITAAPNGGKINITVTSHDAFQQADLMNVNPTYGNQYVSSTGRIRLYIENSSGYVLAICSVPAAFNDGNSLNPDGRIMLITPTSEDEFPCNSGNGNKYYVQDDRQGWNLGSLFVHSE